MLCEQCRQRDATCHSTLVADGVAVDRALCEECFALLAEPEMSRLFLAAKHARCKFCRGPAVSGGMDAAESPGAARAMNFLCGRCGAEYWRHWQEQVGTVSQDLPREEQMAATRAMLEGAEQHMREWVKRRDAEG
jgi:hypothetical protein